MVIEVLEDEYAEVLRRIPGSERLRQLDDMYVFARQMTFARIRSAHPDWTVEEVEREISRSIADAAD